MTEETKFTLESLRDQVALAIDMNSLMVDMIYSEQAKFRKDHPGAHFVIGDFEIKCLNPEKYHLP